MCTIISYHIKLLTNYFSVAFEICDLNGDGYIYRSDVLEIISAASAIFSESGTPLN